jgi:hypothetical protein
MPSDERYEPCLTGTPAPEQGSAQVIRGVSTFAPRVQDDEEGAAEQDVGALFWRTLSRTERGNWAAPVLAICRPVTYRGPGAQA